jgi:hypothetical protein
VGFQNSVKLPETKSGHKSILMKGSREDPLGDIAENEEEQETRKTK